MAREPTATSGGSTAPAPLGEIGPHDRRPEGICPGGRELAAGIPDRVGRVETGRDGEARSVARDEPRGDDLG